MPSSSPISRTRRAALIVTAVLLLHALALWALNSGLLRRVVEIVVPVEVLSEVVEPPRPVIPPPPPPQVRPPPRQAVVRPDTPPPPRPTATPPPVLAMPVNPDPAPQAPTAVPAPPAPLPPMTAPVTTTAVAAAPPKPAPAEIRPAAPPKVELPSSDAAYLQNPQPVYPPMSKRLNEQGKVLVRVLIGVDGTAKKAEIEKSSGFYRLDEAALATVLKWRYVPGTRDGVPEEMWHTAPITWDLKQPPPRS